LHYSGPQLGEVRVLCHLENGCKVLVALRYVFTAVVVTFGLVLVLASYRLHRVCRHLLLWDAIGKVLEGAVGVSESGSECLRADVSPLARNGHQCTEGLLVDLDRGGLGSYWLLLGSYWLLDGWLLHLSCWLLLGSGLLDWLGDFFLNWLGLDLGYNFLLDHNHDKISVFD